MSVEPLSNAPQPLQSEEKTPALGKQRLDEKRKCTTGEWKENDPEGRIRRDEERKRRKYNEKRRSGCGDMDGVGRSDRRGTDRRSERVRESADLRRKLEPKASQPGNVAGGHDLRSSGHGTRPDALKRHNRRSDPSLNYSGQANNFTRPKTKQWTPRTKEATPAAADSVDAVQEMLKSFAARGKEPWAPITGSWGDEMEETDSKNKDTGAPNPWRKSESTGERETNPNRLAKRQRQLDIGKSGPEYKIYCDQVPREQRTKHHPQTPDKTVACSTRSWEGVMRVWRRKLHYWDPPEAAEAYQKKFANIVPFDDDDDDDEDEDEDDGDEDDDDKSDDEEGEEKSPLEDCDMASEENQEKDCDEFEVDGDEDDVDLDEETERKLLEECDDGENIGTKSSDGSQETSTQNLVPNNKGVQSSDSKNLHCEEDITEDMLFSSEI